MRDVLLLISVELRMTPRKARIVVPWSAIHNQYVLPPPLDPWPRVIRRRGRHVIVYLVQASLLTNACLFTCTRYASNTWMSEGRLTDRKKGQTRSISSTSKDTGCTASTYQVPTWSWKILFKLSVARLKKSFFMTSVSELFGSSCSFRCRSCEGLKYIDVTVCHTVLLSCKPVTVNVMSSR
jgi:hypothetical protein